MSECWNLPHESATKKGYEIRHTPVGPGAEENFKAVARGRMANAGVAQFSKQTSIKVLRAGVIPVQVRSRKSRPSYNPLLRALVCVWGGCLVPVVLISSTSVM